MRWVGREALAFQPVSNSYNALRSTAIAACVLLLAVSCGTNDTGTIPAPVPTAAATTAPAAAPDAQTSPPTVSATEPPTPPPPESEFQLGAPTVLDVLDGLIVEPEFEGSGYERDEFEHDRAYLCDEPGTDPYTGAVFDPASCDVDHIVAAKEAFESGAWAWNVSRRRAFGNDGDNLIATRDCVNRSKSADDMAEWARRIGSGTCEGLTTTPQGDCFLAVTTVIVKNSYSLSVDTAEKDALAKALEDCPPDGPMPSQPINFQPEATPIELAPVQPDNSSSDCHPAYSPCLPKLPGDALNFGDLTAAQKPVAVLVPGVDRYRLDRDGDGRGCTS